MANINMRNHGIVEGRLTAEPKKFKNKDGSTKVLFSLFVDNNFLSRDGERKSVIVPVEDFIPADRENKVYDLLKEQDHIGVLFHVQPESYTDASGKTVYVTKLRVDSIDFKETKAAKNARLAAKAVKDAAKANEAPADQVDVDEPPFGE